MVLASSPRVYDDVLQLIGATPLVKIRAEEERNGKARGAVWAKLENANPGGSTKDRIALAMIEEAEKSGRLKPGGVAPSATSSVT